MKRRDLIGKINFLAKGRGQTVRLKEGGSHTKVIVGGRQSVIPRHGEINEITARRIVEHLFPEVGE
jgi:hypothetical protein